MDSVLGFLDFEFVGRVIVGAGRGRGAADVERLEDGGSEEHGSESVEDFGSGEDWGAGAGAAGGAGVFASLS